MQKLGGQRVNKYYFSQEVYKPTRQLAIDETLIKFKGKVHFGQFLLIKPGRFGIKAFTLAESTSGYLLKSRFILVRKVMQSRKPGQKSSHVCN